MKNIFIKSVSVFVLIVCMFSTFGIAKSNDDTRVEAWVIEGYSTSVETFAYTRRVESSKTYVNQTFDFPAYNYDNGNSGLCAPVAGMNLLGYYDGIYSNLIPNFDPFVYKSNGTKVYTADYRGMNVGDELYSLMKTNQSGKGTSIANFKNGFKSYVESKGLKVKNESSEFFLNLFFSTSKYLSYIKQNKPVVIMTDNCQYVDASNFVTKGTSMSIVVQRISKAHAVVAHGYLKYDYYRNEQVSVWSPVWYNPLRFVTETKEVNFRSDEYLVVSFGDGTQGFLDVNKSKITDAFTMEVYK